MEIVDIIFVTAGFLLIVAIAVYYVIKTMAR